MSHSSHPIRRRRAGFLVGVATITAAGVLAAINPATSAPKLGKCDLPSTGEIAINDVRSGISVLKCDLTGRVITGPGGLGITVPKPGQIVGSSSVSVNGSGRTFQVAVSKDGKISFPKEKVVKAPAASTARATAADPGECADPAYSTVNSKVYGTYRWRTGAGTLPARMTPTQARRVFGDAIRNITSSRNNCGFADQVSAKSEYMGTSKRRASITTDQRCGAPDGYSVWSAGDLPSNSVAAACWWGYSTGQARFDVREADVKFNTTDFNFTNAPTSPNCRTAYDIRAVGTHEAGHVFGMGHVGAGHSNLTMYTNSFRCNPKARSLGRGDVRGLRVIY